MEKILQTYVMDGDGMKRGRRQMWFQDIGRMGGFTYQEEQIGRLGAI